MPQVRKGGALCEGLSAVSANSGFEDLLSLSSGWAFEGQLQLAAGPVQAPASATLRITGGGQGGAEPPRAQGRAFQLVAEEVRAVPDAAAGMFLS